MVPREALMFSLPEDPFLLLGWVLIACSGLGLAIYLGGVLAARAHLRAKRLWNIDAFPGVSMLKPLKGLEDDLEANLRSFFEQDYPGPREIVFATSEPEDPALALARTLASDYPDVPVQFVVSDPDFGLNPKVANLAGALAAAQYDLIHQSDANVRARSGYLRQIVAEMRAQDASILTSVVVGTGEKTPGAAMENLQLSAFIAPAMCLALKAVNIACVCGKSMLLYRSELEEELGGLGSVRNVLCEDFVLGERYKALGKKVLLSPTTIENVNRHCGTDRFVERHSRWLKMRVTLHLGGFFADLVSNPVALAALAAVVSGLDATISLAALGVVLAKVAIDQLAVRTTREPMALRYALLGPAKDLMLLPLWINAIFSRTVVWRGRRLRFGKNTQLIPVDAPEATDPAKVHGHG